MFWGVFPLLTDSCRTSRGRSANTPIWRTAEPLGDGPHGPGMTKPRGCSQASLGAWPFRVIDRRSKRHFLRGDLLTTLAWQSLVNGLQSQNNILVLNVEITISVTVFTYYNKHPFVSFSEFRTTPPWLLACRSPHARLHFFSPFNTESTSLYSIYTCP